ncbi:hypothetical protein A2U01_0088898, partial [Trifolium medium]|nr:hypothetical protein [Trifolium medium]
MLPIVARWQNKDKHSLALARSSYHDDVHRRHDMDQRPIKDST